MTSTTTRIGAALLAGSLLISSGGCHTIRDVVSSPAESLEPIRPLPDAPESRAPAELPPGAAAKVCLAAAAEMERHGYTKEAIVEYEKARALDPKAAAGAPRRLAVLYDRLCEDNRARAEFLKAIEVAPKDADLLNDMGYFCYGRGEWAEAEGWFRKALALRPKHARAWVNLGLALAQQDRDSDSLDAFSRAVTPAEARSNLAVIQAQRGRIAESRSNLDVALTLEPQSAKIRAILASLDRADDPAVTAASAETTRPPTQ